MVTLETIDDCIARDLNIAYYCPDNTKGLMFDLEYLQKCIYADWALVLLGVGSGYLKQDSLFEFASKDSNTLTSARLFSTDASTRKIIDYLKDIVSLIDLETWAKAFEKLFYVTVSWLNDNLDLENEKSKYFFQLIWDDFFFIRVGSELVYFIPEEKGLHPQNKPNSNWLISAVSRFQIKEKAKIESEDFHCSEWLEDFESILEGWRMRYYEGEIPQLVKDYEELHKKL